MASTMSLTIDQILRAAKMLEQQQQMSLIDPMSFCNLGQNYENRVMQTKMRGVDISTTTAALALPNSTGSSLRSSPFCSQNSSSPNSPQNGQLLPSNMRGNAKLSSASSIAPLLTGRSSNATSSSSSASVSQSTRQSRDAHNQLEKNRRANLRNYLDKLKSVLPADPESTRDTTLSLLTRARNYIRLVKQQKQSLLLAKQEALAENARLMARLEALNQQNPPVIQEPVQASTQEPTTQQAELQLSDLQALQLFKPEPQHADQQSPLYMEFSPSAKPSNVTAFDNLQPTLNALLNLNALQAALNQATTTTAAALNPLNPVDLLTSVLANSTNTNSFGLPSMARPTTNLMSIDLVNNGLLPSLPLLYPYNTNAC